MREPLPMRWFGFAAELAPPPPSCAWRSPSPPLCGREDLLTAGYSGTPLARKLNLKDGMRVWWDHMPDKVRDEIAREALALDTLPAPEPGLDAAHIFVTRYADIEAKLALLRPLLDPAGFVWVSWPKRASKVDTDITEDRIRDAILPATAALAEQNWVDVKVCAVDDVWSGLKLVIRKAAR